MDTDTEKLKREQAERATEEHRRLEDADQPDEAKQHERRRDKAAYLEEKLAERERAEREAG
jgi:hypothetical protein